MRSPNQGCAGPVEAVLDVAAGAEGDNQFELVGAGDVDADGLAGGAVGRAGDVALVEAGLAVDADLHIDIGEGPGTVVDAVVGKERFVFATQKIDEPALTVDADPAVVLRAANPHRAAAHVSVALPGPGQRQKRRLLDADGVECAQPLPSSATDLDAQELVGGNGVLGTAEEPGLDLLRSPGQRVGVDLRAVGEEQSSLQNRRSAAVVAGRDSS